MSAARRKALPAPVVLAGVARETIATHLRTAKAIADIIHICGGCAIDGSESRLDELDAQTLRALVYAIRQHIEEAEELQIREDNRIAAESRQRDGGAS